MSLSRNIGRQAAYTCGGSRDGIIHNSDVDMASRTKSSGRSHANTMKRMHRVGHGIWPLIAGLALYVVCVVTSPIGRTLEIGGDEAVEFNKARLLAERPERVNEMWNDQPMGYTAVVAHIMMWRKTDYVLVTRTMTASLFVVTVLMVGTWLVPASRVARGIFGVAVLTWPGIMQLSMSAMLELVAICLGWIAIVVAYLGTSVRSRGRQRVAMFVAGLVMGAAGTVKLTVVILVPVLAGLLINAWVIRQNRRRGLGEVFCQVGLLALGCIVLPACIIATFGPLGIFGGIANHVNAAVVDAAREEGHGFVNPWGWGFAGVLAIAAVSQRAVWKEEGARMVIASVALLSAGFVHLVYNPWWYYYEVHFVWPTAMLASIGAPAIWQEQRTGGLCTWLNSKRAFVALVALAFLLTVGLREFVQPFERLRHTEKVSDNEIVEALRSLREHASDVVCLGGYRTAHYAGMTIPPYFTVPATKRKWTGMLQDIHVVEEIQKAKPALIISPRSKEHHLREEVGDWGGYLENNYGRVQFIAENGGTWIWAHHSLGLEKSLGIAEQEETWEVLRDWGVSTTAIKNLR